MEDYLGREIEVGDEVLWAVTHYTNSGASLGQATVIGFTPQKVRVQVVSSGYSDYARDKVTLKDPKKLAVIGKELKR